MHLDDPERQADRLADAIDAYAEADADFRALKDLGISIDQVAAELEDEGVKKFSDSFDSLMTTIGEKRRAMRVA